MTAHQDDMDAWLVFLNGINEWFIELNYFFNDTPGGYLDLCNISLTAWTAQRQDCGSKQGEFQVEHCKWIHYKHSRCDILHQCAAQHEATYNAERLTSEAQSATRTNEVEMLTLVICYLEYIRDTEDGTADQMHSGCALSDELKAEINANYSNVYNHDLTAPHCNPLDGVQHDVNDGPAWAAAVYSDIDSVRSPYDPVPNFCATGNWTTA